MLWTIVVILLILWLLGFISGTVGSLIHILLVIAIIVVLVRVIQGRSPVYGRAERLANGRLRGKWRGLPPPQMALFGANGSLTLALARQGSQWARGRSQPAR